MSDILIIVARRFFILRGNLSFVVGLVCVFLLFCFLLLFFGGFFAINFNKFAFLLFGMKIRYLARLTEVIESNNSGQTHITSGAHKDTAMSSASPPPPLPTDTHSPTFPHSELKAVYNLWPGAAHVTRCNAKRFLQRFHKFPCYLSESPFTAGSCVSLAAHFRSTLPMHQYSS